MLRKIRSLVSNSDYFGIYDNALSKKECEILINQFEKSPQTPGVVYTKGDVEPTVHRSEKSSIELNGTKFSDHSVISRIILPRLTECIVKYKKTYNMLDYTAQWRYWDHYNVQKYETEEDGFKIWHTEHGPDDLSSKRIMAGMFYLNDAKSGTEFMNYPTVRAKRGRCVIWPAFWTHVHRGELPNKGIKYLATGWISLENEII